jgi:hypothetical protein
MYCSRQVKAPFTTGRLLFDSDKVQRMVQTLLQLRKCPSTITLFFSRQTRYSLRHSENLLLYCRSFHPLRWFLLKSIDLVSHCELSLLNPVYMLNLLEANQSRRSHGGAWGAMRYSSYSFLTSSLVGGEWSSSRPDRASPRGKDPRYPLYRRLGGPQSWSGHRGPLPLPGIEPHSSSL